MSLIGILRWIVELGRVDICCEVSMMSSFSAMPRDGQLEQLYHIFAFLKNNHNSRLVFDPLYPNIDMEKFERRSWEQYYGSGGEQIPNDCPEAIGKEFVFVRSLMQILQEIRSRVGLEVVSL